ncbi:hypothetical protein SAMN05443377_1454 [Propionibacterium cyclohexanicum]|uniref:Cof subfamily of IIB subfamily of haloacid dehalogenase superfamily/HAD-superfamily hydrolase, subfamily IIB n=1 Tax=Propionibacterium cyclohexanicum TaxID=64702 RepID=A0A1H9U6S1_9ACTN|nr:Cof-type HAD-IIB family hydrolase [Propionibacterium cyclohexanicum]SES05280.1 hypothetical protein SAMN05443377_1454 [Propionibacterium cyclohexanicum]
MSSVSRNRAIFAIDLDGTLIGDDHELSSLNLSAIRRAEHAGCTIVVATGRSLDSARKQLTALGTAGYILALNGAIITTGAGNILFSQPMSPEAALRVCRVGEQGDATVFLTGMEANYRFKNGAQAPNLVQEFRPGDSRLTDCGYGQAQQVVESMDIYKAALMEEDVSHLSVLKDELSRDGLPVVSSDVHYVEVSPEGVSKGSGLARLVTMIGLDNVPIIAFGDQENDLEMLRKADVGLAMGNALPVVKQSADRVIGSNNESAVGQAILEFLEDPASFIQK